MIEQRQESHRSMQLVLNTLPISALTIWLGYDREEHDGPWTSVRVANLVPTTPTVVPY